MFERDALQPPSLDPLAKATVPLTQSMEVSLAPNCLAALDAMAASEGVYNIELILTREDVVECLGHGPLHDLGSLKKSITGKDARYFLLRAHGEMALIMYLTSESSTLVRVHYSACKLPIKRALERQAKRKIQFSTDLRSVDALDTKELSRCLQTKHVQVVPMAFWEEMGDSTMQHIHRVIGTDNFAGLNNWEAITPFPVSTRLSSSVALKPWNARTLEEENRWSSRVV